MNLIFLGAPGAGKGTVAKKFVQNLKIPHISSGDIFREAIKNKTELGILADGYISKGQLVPDEVTIGIMEQRISEPDCADGFILDGYPRTIAQAESLDKFLATRGTKINKAVCFVCDEDVIIKRLTGRRLCSSCKETYNLARLPEGTTTCLACGAPLITRDDDRLEVISKRFETYHKETEPLIDYYKKSRRLCKIQADDSIDETYNNVLYALRIKGV